MHFMSHSISCCEGSISCLAQGHNSQGDKVISGCKEAIWNIMKASWLHMTEKLKKKINYEVVNKAGTVQHN